MPPFLFFQQETTNFAFSAKVLIFFIMESEKKRFSAIKQLRKRHFLKSSIIIFNTTYCACPLDFDTRCGIIVWLYRIEHNILC